MTAAEKNARLSEARQANGRVKQLEQDINEFLAWTANPEVSKIAIALLERALRIIKAEAEKSIAEEPVHFSITALNHPLRVEVA